MSFDVKKIEEIFPLALKKLTSKWGEKAKLASEIGISKELVSQMVKGTRASDENTRRKIAAALGYPGRQYEDFLDIGRAILAGDDPDALIAEHTKQGFGPANQAPDWLMPILDDLKTLDPRDQKTVAAVVASLKKDDGPKIV